MNPNLTRREIQVLQAIVDNEGNLRAVASKLKISHNTVRVHLHRASVKLDRVGEGRLATVLAAQEANIIHID